MVAGGLLASLSFLVTGFVQLSVNVGHFNSFLLSTKPSANNEVETLPTLPASDEAFVSVWNQLDGCSVTATFPGHNPFNVASNITTVDNRKTGESSMHLKAPSGTKTWTVPIQLSYSGCSNNKFQNLPNVFNAKLETTKIYYVAISPNGIYQGKSDPSKPTQGTGEFSLG
ncbi:hypothetical protein ANCDUO_00714 [Ancylostoma duodenale]|uniref:Uncharacterized protein n=1 Tax=Ancylostoma duodenale TaxID=51022 RepID=A0A0C2H530_9BILA|nr:hypothetical protein ANCDUO_00714 [Ancylostoma duodenale]